MKNASKKEMKKIFDQLNSIKRVTARDSLFDDILQSIAIQQQTQVPKIWLQLAAAVFIALVLVEVYLFLYTQQLNQGYWQELFVFNQDNLLYAP